MKAHRDLGNLEQLKYGGPKLKKPIAENGKSIPSIDIHMMATLHILYLNVAG